MNHLLVVVEGLVFSIRAGWSQVSILFEDPYKSAKTGKSNVALLRDRSPHLEPGLGRDFAQASDELLILTRDAVG